MLGLLGLAALFKLNDTNERWWIAFAMLVTSAGMLGIQVSTLKLVIGVGLWKVFSDVCRA